MLGAGDLDVFGPGDMMQPFEEAVKALKARVAMQHGKPMTVSQIGEISGVVHTDSGAHIIKRTK